MDVQRIFMMTVASLLVVGLVGCEKTRKPPLNDLKAEEQSITEGKSLEPDECQQAAVAEIEKLGGNCTGKPVIAVSLYDTQITDADLEHLKGLPRLVNLQLDNTPITGPGLEHLKELTSLQMLCFNYTQITEDGAKKLQDALPKCEIRH